jgi:hypothetical protein
VARTNIRKIDSNPIIVTRDNEKSIIRVNPSRTNKNYKHTYLPTAPQNMKQNLTELKAKNNNWSLQHSTFSHGYNK